MAKPSVLPGQHRRVTATTQAHIAQGEVVLKLWQLGQPWACWAGLGGCALGFHLGLPGFWTSAGIAMAGCVIAGFDAHLRSHRVFIAARLIGPLTILLATAWLTAAVVTGFSKPLLTAYLIGGILGSIVWDIWLAAGEHKDISRAFLPAGETHLGGAWLSGTRRAGHAITTTLHFPGGHATTADAGDVVENLQGSMGHPPGSWTITPNPKDASQAFVKISDPDLIDRAPLAWPGPSHPGESIALPIRPGRYQDGDAVWYCLLHHHVIGMGSMGSGKTMSWLWNQVAEGITRVDYACIAADVTKGLQFIGPLAPALHQMVTSDEDAIMMADGIHRVVKVRGDFLGKQRLTEWQPGCGLSFLDLFWEEAPDIVALLGTGERLKNWKSDVRALRTMGGRFNLSLQRSEFREVPVMARSQMGKLCFGVNEAEDAKFGLSNEQRKRGVRPQLWGTKVPGKCVLDAPSIPDDRITMPWRWWSWPSAERIAAYAGEFPASQRPVDDVTGEAYFNGAPGPLASTAFPAKPSLFVVGSSNGSSPATVTRTATLPPRPPGKLSQERAIQAVRDQVEAWRLDGRRLFRIADLYPLLPKIDRERVWLYQPLTMLENEGTIKKHGIRKPWKWEILPRQDGQET